MKILETFKKKKLFNDLITLRLHQNTYRVSDYKDIFMRISSLRSLFFHDFECLFFESRVGLSKKIENTYSID